MCRACGAVFCRAGICISLQGFIGGPGTFAAGMSDPQLNRQYMYTAPIYIIVCEMSTAFE